MLQLTCGARTDIDALGDTLRQSLRQAGFQLLPASHEAFGDKLDPLLREGWAGQRLDVSTWEDESSFLAFVTVGLAALAVLVGAIVLAIVMVGLFVSLNVAVRERTREIGTLRAMGMHRPSVVGMFVLEGLLLGLTASSTGAGVASPVCPPARRRAAARGHLPPVLQRDAPPGAEPRWRSPSRCSSSPWERGSPPSSPRPAPLPSHPVPPWSPCDEPAFPRVVVGPRARRVAAGPGQCGRARCRRRCPRSSC